jgi:hypothetical protein
MLSLSHAVKILNKSAVPISFLPRKLGSTLFLLPWTSWWRMWGQVAQKKSQLATIFVEWTCEEEFIQERRQLFEKGFEFKIYCLKKWFLTIELKNLHWGFKRKPKTKTNYTMAQGWGREGLAKNTDHNPIDVALKRRELSRTWSSLMNFTSWN